MELEGIIVGHTKVMKILGNSIVYTNFSVKTREDEIKEMTINGLHENLLPGRKIKLNCFPIQGGYFSVSDYTLINYD